MTDDLTFDFVTAVSALSDEQRLRFYEDFAHNLTVTIRAVWDDSSITDAEKVNRIRCINEILHRVTAKVAMLRRAAHEWSESDMWGEVRRWVGQDKSIAGNIGWAIRRSIKSATC